MLVVADRRAVTRNLVLPSGRRRCGWRCWPRCLDTIANVAMLLALHASLLSLAGVLISLYPAATVVLALGGAQGAGDPLAGGRDGAGAGGGGNDRERLTLPPSVGSGTTAATVGGVGWPRTL